MNYEYVNEEEVMKKIADSAADVLVPESLEPENIKIKLQGQKKAGKFSKKKFAEIAAAVALVAVVGGTGIYAGIGNHGPENGSILSTGNGPAEKETEKGEVQKKKEAGSYHLADSYDEVYDAIAYREKESWIDKIFSNNIKGDINFSTDVTVEDSVAESGTANVENEGNADYSQTNTQVEGVDESDFVKNDGNYLYVQTENQVDIIDIQKEKMEKLATMEPELGTTGSIVDMYLDKDRLYVIVEKRNTEHKEKSITMGAVADTIIAEDIAFYAEEEMYTELQTYDISDRKNSKLLGTVTVDGTYKTSRKTGDYVYLFTNRYVGNRTEDDTDGIIPKVNGKEIGYDCIYLQKEAYNELIAVSVDVNKPKETADQIVLMDSGMELYMGPESIYLYNRDYTGDNSYTDIVKFSYKDGQMNAVSSTSVKGTIEDTFAISEKDGILRVLTTNWKAAGSTNQFYLLDENLDLKGSLKNIATGEEIYAARYIGDMAYFITYHNTDPLFAVDISDPANPKMLGQLKVTGFSDYLHPFGEDRLLGIGYETDPDTSERLGVKLTMFDISDPANLTVVDTVTLSGDYCGAASDYKSALVDVEKNLIGFEVTGWEMEREMRYLVYSWEDDHFVKKMAQQIEDDECYDETMIRGAYAGDRFYLVSGTAGGFRIRSYDMEKEFEQQEELR